MPESRGTAFRIREATTEDVPALFDVRTSVVENHLGRERLAELGITEESLAAEIGPVYGAWCADVDGVVVAFAMAHRESANVFALFVRPEWEGRGVGSVLLATTVDWLRGLGHDEANLTTGRDTRAFDFYRRKGWRHVGYADGGDAELRLALAGPGSNA